MGHYEHSTALISEITPVRFGDDTHIHPKLVSFMRTQQARYPLHKFGVSTDCRSRSVTLSTGLGESYVQYGEVWVYFEGDIYATGRIGFCTPNPNSNADTVSVYTVYSRAIQNDRFRASEWGHYAVTTQDIGKATKNASKFLRRYTPAEHAEVTRGVYTDEFCTPLNIAIKQRTDLERDMRWSTQDKLIAELTQASKDGYQIRDSTVARQLTEHIKLGVEIKNRGDQLQQAYHVRVYESRGVQMVSVLLADTTNKDDHYAGGHNVMPLQDLPYDIAGKIAVLSMMDKESYVEGVGLQAVDGTYWISREGLL